MRAPYQVPAIVLMKSEGHASVTGRIFVRMANLPESFSLPSSFIP